MAGSILISEEKGGLSLSGPAFLFYVEAIRDQLMQGPGARYIQQIYFGHDESASNFICLWEQESAGFNLFYAATEAASHADDQSDESGHEIWQELLKMLRNDSRWIERP